MPQSIRSPEVVQAITDATVPRTQTIQVGSRRVKIPQPFPSPADWRDHWIYFVFLDRFNNPAAPPRHLPWDAPEGRVQGGTFEGVRQKLDYLQQLGAGALWLTPVLKNCAFDAFAHHGYAIQNFLEVDPRRASDPANAEVELQRLINEAHARGMYVIFDIVLNHAGDVFEYAGHGATAPWVDHPLPVRWRDASGQGRADWLQPPINPPAEAVVWPAELQRNELFRRQGKGGEAAGDFESLKEIVTDFQEGGRFPVRDALIRSCEYLIARFDVDGFRIDTLKFIERDFARLFGNAMREFASRIGKKNFFTFGEVYDADEHKIAAYIGRNTSDHGDLVGVDAALDFPLFFKLARVAKGFEAPSVLSSLFEHRRGVQRTVMSSHGEASRYFVTFFDNHDLHERFYFRDAQQRFDAQLTLALGCLFGLQGIPCVYYGTEQGLAGRGDRPEFVREALWGRPNAFDAGHPFYAAVQQLAEVRVQRPSLRYGRQYFRPVSGNGLDFGISPFPGGIVAFSRILDGQETLVVANTHTSQAWRGQVLVDRWLNASGTALPLLWSNLPDATPPGTVLEKVSGSVDLHETSGAITHGPVHAVEVTLRPMEAQLIGA